MKIDLSPERITPATIRNLAIAAAILLAPVLSYSSAFLMDMQKGSVGTKSAAPAKLVQAPASEAILPADLIDKIAEAILLAEG